MVHQLVAELAHRWMSAFRSAGESAYELDCLPVSASVSAY